ncbi:Uncharacterized protein BM_BM1506, partial [Brugia malayi]
NVVYQLTVDRTMKRKELPMLSKKMRFEMNGDT